MINNNTRIFLAGHNGLVGKALNKKIIDKFDCHIITSDKSDLDLRIQNDVNAFFRRNKIDYVVIAAAKVGGIFANSTYPAEFIFDNLMIQSNLINASYKNNIKNLLFLGSSCIYPRNINRPIKEEDLMKGELEKTNEPYAIAKISGIKMCSFYNEQYSTSYRSVMPTNLYGPGDSFHEINGHVIPSLLTRFHKANKERLKEIKVWGTGKPLREFMHVDDMADACTHIMSLDDKAYYKILTNNISHINIGTGQEISIRELSELIKEITEFKGDIIFDKSKPDGTPRKLLDITRIKSSGWKPKIDLKKGILNTYKWYQENDES